MHKWNARSSVISSWILVALLLAGCGGGGDSSGPSPSASLSYPSSPLTLVVGSQISPVKPTVTGDLSTFSISPALPPGLALDSASGTLSGKPTAIAAASTYTVSASGNGGTASASVSITVNDTPPASVSYGTAALTFTTNIASQKLTPQSAGGAITHWDINPALPAGLSLDSTDGSISGTPTAASASTPYTVTAQNSGGHSTVSLTIEVDDGGILLDLGHTTGFPTLRFTGTRVLSLDSTRHWVLWDYAAATKVASGDLVCPPIPHNPCPVFTGDMAGGTVVLKTRGFEVHSSSTGALLSTISADVSWWSLASDGSYITAGTTSNLVAWSPSGQVLLTRSGDYSKAVAFAAPGEIRIAAGPAGQSVIETIQVANGTSSVSNPFNGQISSWFLDGSRFLATAGATTLVYSKDVVQQAAISLSAATTQVVGQGNWVWSLTPAQLNVFAIASSSTPVASFAIDSLAHPTPSALTIGIVTHTPSSTGLSVIDLSGGTPSKQDYSLPIVPSASYAAVSASQWIDGSGGGALLDGASLGTTPRYFGYGAAWSIAGSTGHIAVATASGRIVYFNASTLAQEGTIPYSASKLALSSDGSVLVAAGEELDAQYHDDWSLKIYSLPDATLLHTWPYSFAAGTFPQDFSLSGTGAVLGQVLSGPASTYTQQVNSTTGGSPILSNSVGSQAGPQVIPPVRLSPDGTLVAAETSFLAASAGTNILKNGSLVTAVSGFPVGWIDNDHLLVNTYTAPAGLPVYAACSLYNSSGSGAGSCALPEVTLFQPLTSDSIYAINLGVIMSVSTGNVIWMSGDQLSLPAGHELSGPSLLQTSAVAGNRVVFVAGARVIAQGH